MRDWTRFYFSFKGRATRYDFNVRYALVAFIGMIVMALLDWMLFGALGDGPFSNVFGLLALFATFAVVCRRLHDLGFSGWWQVPVHCMATVCLAVLIVAFGTAIVVNPLAGGLVGLMGFFTVFFFYILFFLALSMKRGTYGPNKYGADPLEVISNDGQ